MERRYLIPQLVFFYFKVICKRFVLGGLIFSDKFIQIATYLPSENMYGWGENIHQTLKVSLKS